MDLNLEGNFVFLGDEKKVLGAILFEDEIRSESKNIFEKFLQDKKINVSILTGDNQDKANKIAEILNIKNVIANSSPKEKLEYIKNFKRKVLLQWLVTV